MIRLLAILALIATLTFPAHAEPITVVAMQVPPLEYQMDGEAMGLNVDIAREALSRMGYEAVFVFVPWQRALDMVKKGTADAILDVAWTRDRTTYLRYPDEANYNSGFYAFKLKSRDITLDDGLGNLDDYVLSVGRGYSYGPVFDAKLRSGNVRVEEVVLIESSVSQLVRGRVDMFPGERLTYKHILRELGHEDDIDIVCKTGTDKEYRLGVYSTHLAFSRQVYGPEIAQVYSDVLRGMHADGSYARLFEKYRK